MTAERVIAFILFAVVAAVTPGPSNIILTSTGANIGVLRGLPCLCGVVVGMGTIVFIAAFGFGSVVVEHPMILHALKFCGISFLIWLSWKIATAKRSNTATGTKFLGFWGAAAFQWVNPKSWIVSVSAVGAYLSPDENSALIQSMYFGILFVIAAIPSCFIWLAFGATIQCALHTEHSEKMFNLTIGMVLAGSTLLIL